LIMHIEMRPIDSIKPYDKNPRINDATVDAVAASIKEFGFRQPIVVDEDGTIIVGHTRYKAALKLGMTEVPVHVAVGLTPAQARAYRVADNQTATLSTWDESLLPLELLGLQEMGFDLNLTGFSADELTRLLQSESTEGQTDPDDIPGPPDEATTQPGDLWVLGKHRVLCGDSSKPEDVDRLLDGARVHLVNTDPPYNVKVEPRSNNAIAAGLSSFEGTKHHQKLDLERHPGKSKPTQKKLRPKDRPLANDFVTFLVLARRAAAVRKRESIGSWLHGVAYRIAVRAKQKAAKRHKLEKLAAVPERASVASDLAWRELQALIDDELARLPEKYLAPFVLCCLQGRSREEVAAELGWHKGTVSSRIAHARRLLRGRMARRGVSLSAVLTAGVLWGRSASAAVPAALARTTVTVAAGRACGRIAPAVAALAAGPSNTVIAGKLFVSLALFLTASVLGMVGYRLIVAKPSPSVKARQAENSRTAAPPDRLDRRGDQLPPGALARLGTTRFRHGGWLNRLAFSPDGTRLFGVGNEGRQWEAASGRLLGVFGEQADALAFLDGGKRILTGGSSLVVWDAAECKEVKRLPLEGGLHHSSLSPDEKLLAGVGSNGALVLVDPATGAVLNQLNGHEDQLGKRPQSVAPRIVQIQSIAFSPDGKSLASACFQDSRVFIWDPATGKVRHMLPGHNRPYVVLFSPNSRVLAVGGEDCLIHLWDVSTGRKLQELRGHVGGIQGLAFSPDGLSLASGASGNPPGTKDEAVADSTIRLWDLRTGESRSLPGPER
jgi:DNA-directed RNA polymerase specialized sigma24 family protein